MKARGKAPENANRLHLVKPLQWLLFGLHLILATALRAQTADLLLSCTSSVSIVSAGQYFTFGLTVSNAGPGTASAVALTNQLPPGATLISATASQGTSAVVPGFVTGDLGSLAAGSKATLILELRADTGGTLTNGATVSSTIADPVASNNATTNLVSVTLARFVGAGPMLAARFSHTATLLTNGQVLIVGGSGTNLTERYIPSTRSFIAGPNLLTARSNQTATRLGDGRILVAAGHVNTAEICDPLAASFKFTAGTLAVARWDHSAALLGNGQVLLSGGGTPNSQSELFNPATETFSLVGGQTFGWHYSFSAVLADGRVLVVGGYGPGSAAVYNPVTGTFAPTGEVPWWRWSATTLPNGKVLLIGFDYNLGPAADLYDPVAGTFTSTGPPLESRAYHTATLLPNGKVLVVGGFAYDGGYAPVRDNVELYDPITGTFTRTARLNTARAYHTATLLDDGTVLISGGINNIDAKTPIFANAEIYDPNASLAEPSLSVLDASVPEGNSGSNWLTFTVQLSAPSTNEVTAGWSVDNGTAHWMWEFGGFDFIPMSGTVVIPAGATNATFSIPVLGDNIHEPDETVIARLNLPTHAWLARAVAIGTIVNDDPLPVINVAPVSKPEGDTGVTEFVFNVTLSAPSLDAVTVDYSTVNQTALAGTDYQSVAGTLVFPSQTTNLTVTVPVIGNLLAEPDKAFALVFTNAQYATLGDPVVGGTILNDDGITGQIHHLEFSFITVSNLQSLGFPVTITARDFQGNLVSDFTGPIVLTVLTTNVIASNLDFQLPNLAPWTPVTNAPLPGPYAQANFDTDGDGRLSTAFRINAGDGYDGISQSIWLAGGLTYNASARFGFALGHDDCSWGHGVAHLQLGDQDSVLGMPTLCHTEQGRGSVSLNFTAPTNGYYPLNLIFDRSDSSDPPYYGYADDVRVSPLAFAPLTLTNITNGVWSGTLTITQAFTSLTLKAEDGFGHDAVSNPFDVVPSADLALSGSSQIQGTPPLRTGMNLLLRFSLTNRGPSTATNAIVQFSLPLNVSLVGTTNSTGTVSNGNGLLTWTLPTLARNNAASLSVLLRADIPGAFTNTVIASSSTAELNGADNLLTLANAILPPLLTIADASAPEGEPAGMLFSLSLSGGSAQTISVDFSSLDGSAKAGVDYFPTNGTLFIPPFATNAGIRVFAIDNILDQPDRTFSLTLSNPTNAEFADALAIGTIVDDDPPPTVGIGNTAVVEGDAGTTSAIFPVTLSKPAISNVVVTWSTLPGTATPGNDYIPATNTVTFPAGATNQSITVQVLGNTVNEPDETFFVTLKSPTYATLAPGQDQAVCTIINDDAVAGRLDHFVFEPVSSPQKIYAPFRITIHAVDYQGTLVPGFNGSVSLSAQTDDWVTEKLVEDFEDGDLAGWTNGSPLSLIASNVNDQAASGSRSLWLSGKSAVASPSFGFRRLPANGVPNRVSFAARVGQVGAQAGRLVITSGRAVPLDFYFDSNGSMKLVNGNTSFSQPYLTNHWYRFEFGLDQTSGKISGRIDGALVITNFPFSTDTNTTTQVLTLENVNLGQAWFDDIHLYDLTHTNLFAAPTNLVAFTNGTWTGPVSAWPVASKAYLVVSDGSEHIGQSGLFDLLPAVRLNTPPVISGDSFHLEVFGVSGVNYVLHASTNLVHWTPILAFVCNETPTIVIDPESSNFIRRFYRVGTLATLPAPKLSIAAPKPSSPATLDLVIESLPGLACRVEQSSNLASWLTLTNLQTTGSLTFVTAPFSPAQPQRFYRVAAP